MGCVCFWLSVNSIQRKKTAPTKTKQKKAWGCFRNKRLVFKDENKTRNLQKTTKFFCLVKRGVLVFSEFVTQNATRSKKKTVQCFFIQQKNQANKTIWMNHKIGKKEKQQNEKKQDLLGSQTRKQRTQMPIFPVLFVILLSSKRKHRNRVWRRNPWFGSPDTSDSIKSREKTNKKASVFLLSFLSCPCSSPFCWCFFFLFLCFLFCLAWVFFIFFCLELVLGYLCLLPSLTQENRPTPSQSQMLPYGNEWSKQAQTGRQGFTMATESKVH